MHDKLSDHYTSSKNYIDENQNTRSFDFIDHDVKTKIGVVAYTEEEIAKAKKSTEEFRKKTIEAILALPASALPISVNHTFALFTNRGDAKNITWNETALKDPTIDIWRLVEIKNFTENNLRGRGLI